MAQDVSDFVAECKVCQERQEPYTLYGLLQPTQISGANQLLWIDFAEMPRSDEGYIGVLAMQDGFDKLAAFAPVKDLKASSLAKGLRRGVDLPPRHTGDAGVGSGRSYGERGDDEGVCTSTSSRRSRQRTTRNLTARWRT